MGLKEFFKSSEQIERKEMYQNDESLHRRDFFLQTVKQLGE